MPSRRVVPWRLLLAASLLAVAAARDQTTQDFAQRIASLERRDGLLRFYVDARAGRLYADVDAAGASFLHGVLVVSGAGWPLDRSAVLSEAGVVRLERRGGRVFLIRANDSARASAPADEALRRAIAAALPESVVASLPVLAEDAGRALVDLTEFCLGDPGVAAAIAARSETVRPDRERSRIVVESAGGTAGASQIDASLTFVSDRPGVWLQRQAADRRSLTVRVRHLFMAMPAPGFQPRALDPRMGFAPLAVDDFSQAHSGSYGRSFISRWRLTGDGARRPLTISLEQGLPPIYRQAFRESVEYWRRVFERVGFSDAIRGEELPPGADPLDLRYPITVVWAPDRDPRASQGHRLIDPRTGEILKASIVIDSFREIVDRNTYRALRPALKAGQPDEDAFVLARLRWVMTHELAHMIAGLSHNTISRSQAGFFVPLLKATAQGQVSIDLSAAYADAPLPYDEWHIRYAYANVPAADEAAALADIVRQGLSQGLRFVTDVARSVPAATGRLQGGDAVTELERESAVRAALLRHFDERALDSGEPLAVLFDRLVPAYFNHQYAVAAVAKMICGEIYGYAIRGDGQPAPTAISRTDEVRAIAALMAQLAPEALRISARIAALIPPRPPALALSELQSEVDTTGAFVFLNGESEPIRIPVAAGGVFEPLGWARALSGVVLDQVFDRQRLARIVALRISGAATLSLEEVLQQVVAATWDGPPPADPAILTLAWVSRRAVLDRLIGLSNDDQATPEVRAAAVGQLRDLLAKIKSRPAASAADLGGLELARRDIERALGASAAISR